MTRSHGRPNNFSPTPGTTFSNHTKYKNYKPMKTVETRRFVFTVLFLLSAAVFNCPLNRTRLTASC